MSYKRSFDLGKPREAAQYTNAGETSVKMKLDERKENLAKLLLEFESL